MFSELLRAFINLIFYEALRALWTTHGKKWLPDLIRYKTLKMYLLLQNISKDCRKKYQQGLQSYQVAKLSKQAELFVENSRWF